MPEIKSEEVGGVLEAIVQRKFVKRVFSLGWGKPITDEIITTFTITPEFGYNPVKFEFEGYIGKEVVGKRVRYVVKQEEGIVDENSFPQMTFTKTTKTLSAKDNLFPDYIYEETLFKS